MRETTGAAKESAANSCNLGRHGIHERERERQSSAHGGQGRGGNARRPRAISVAEKCTRNWSEGPQQDVPIMSLST